jgi:hypothetical protein
MTNISKLIPTYEVFALRDATRDGQRRNNFLKVVMRTDAPMPMDYFVWLIKGEHESF